MIDTNRRTGRTGSLIIKAIKELLEKGEATFVDHKKLEGEYSFEHYRGLGSKIATIMYTLFVDDKLYTQTILPNGGGILLKRA